MMTDRGSGRVADKANASGSEDNPTNLREQSKTLDTLERGKPVLVRWGAKTFGGDPLAYLWCVVSARVSDSIALALAENHAAISRFECYGGPGRRFANSPSIRRSRTRTLVTQRVGLDV